MQKQEMVKSKWELKYDLNVIVEEKFRTAKSIIKNVKYFAKEEKKFLKYLMIFLQSYLTLNLMQKM